MAASRKDSKGRVLKTGESESKDGLYQYRYTESTGERKTIYANNLNDLRKKEQEIQKLLELGVSYFEGSMTVTNLLERYLSLKQHLRANTVRGYHITIKTLQNDKVFCNMKTTTLAPDYEQSREFEEYMKRYRAGLEALMKLEEIV